METKKAIEIMCKLDDVSTYISDNSGSSLFSFGFLFKKDQLRKIREIQEEIRKEIEENNRKR